MMKLYLATDKALVVIALEGNDRLPKLKLMDFPSRCVAVDPVRPGLVYSGSFGDGVWYSRDAGRNWRPGGNGISHSKAFSLAVSRTERVDDRGVVYVETEPSAVFRSDDGGDSWRECTGVTDLPSSGEWSFPPRPDPHTESRLFVVIEAGALIQSPDSGATWKDRVPTGPIDTHQLASHLAAPGRLYSAAGDGYFESTDAGETWQQLEEGLGHDYVWSVAVDAGDPDTGVIASAASARHSHDKRQAESFIYRRTAKTPLATSQRWSSRPAWPAHSAPGRTSERTGNVFRRLGKRSVSLNRRRLDLGAVGCDLAARFRSGRTSRIRDRSLSTRRGEMRSQLPTARRSSAT